MKFTLSWLARHLETEAPLDEIGRRLTALGLEVEEIVDPAQALSGFIVGHVLAAEKHPNADRLKLCTVDSGTGVLQVVCGAPNARAGLKVILARPGTRIPASGEVLKKGKVRGIESQAMMCSWRELALGEDHEGIAELAVETPVGARLIDVLAFDPLIDVSITPNRADCLGVRGIARDLAAAGLGRLKPLLAATIPGSYASPIGVRLDLPGAAARACPHFVGRHIRGVVNRESPDWLKALLSAVGLRPISALVDITNFMAVDLCRPLHVFDADRLAGDLTVRLARPGETLAALNGKTYVLADDMTVIADANGVQSLAGVIGGEATACSAATTNVFLETANFDPIRTASAGRRLDILSDARFRFERGIDPAFLGEATEIATRLILDLCGGEASDPVIVGAEPAWQKSIALRADRVAKLGGHAIPVARQAEILTALGCSVALDADALTVAPPAWRGDLGAEHDLVEEVLRVEGYDAIAAVPLPRPAMPRPILTPAQRRRGWVRRALAARGLVETVTWSFLPSAQAELFGGGDPALRLANPISSDLDRMRPGVLPNLVTAAARNADRGQRDLGLFEVGPQFDGPGPGRQQTVAGGIRAGAACSRHWAGPARAVDAFDAKADALAALAAAGLNTDSLSVTTTAPAWYHPGRSGALRLGNTVLAHFGELHPAVRTAMDVKGALVGFEVFLDALPQPKQKAGKTRPALVPQPLLPLERDFAFVVGTDVAADALVKAARGADRALIVAAGVFDLHQGPPLAEGTKSVGITVTLQPTDKTLTDQDIEAVCQAVVAMVAKATGATLRG